MFLSFGVGKLFFYDFIALANPLAVSSRVVFYIAVAVFGQNRVAYG
jgi:hypothetical protein